MSDTMARFPGAAIAAHGHPLVGNSAATANAIRTALLLNRAGEWSELAALLGCATDDLRWTATRLYQDHNYSVLSMESIADRLEYVRTHRHPQTDTTTL